MLIEFTKGKLTLPVFVQPEEVYENYGRYAFVRIEGSRAEDILRRLGEGRIKVKHGKILQKEKSVIVLTVLTDRKLADYLNER